MHQPRHKAAIAGLAVTLTLGGVALPAVATTSDAPATDSDPNGMGDPAPTDFNKADYYQGAEGSATFATARSASKLSPVSLSDEMKYFTKFESGCDYNKGLSYGDGYNAMGYYQFDRRYSLLPFIQQVYSCNSTKYSMFKAVLAYRDLLSSPSYAMYDYVTRQLTASAQILNEAWHAAYAADPVEFAALQDAYAYNNYYLPVQSSLLNTYGVDVRNRADCVKGLVWGMCNLFGQGGVQKFFRGANIDNHMTDRELVTALCDTVVDRVAEWYPGQPQYHAGWKNRYKKEKAVCLSYLDRHDAEQNAGGQQQPDNAPSIQPGGDDAPQGGSGATDQGPTEGQHPGGEGATDSGATGGAPEAPGGSQGSGSDPVPSEPSDGNGSTGGEDVVQPEANGGEGQPTPDAGVTEDSAPQGRPEANGSGSSDSGDAPSAGQEPQGSNDASVDRDGSSISHDDATDGQSAPVDNSVSAEDEANSQDKMNTFGSSSDDKGKSESKAAASSNARHSLVDLPDTGDIAALVLTGASGLAVAGGSFLSLAKKERSKKSDDE